MLRKHGNPKSYQMSYMRILLLDVKPNFINITNFFKYLYTHAAEWNEKELTNSISVAFLPLAQRCAHLFFLFAHN